MQYGSALTCNTTEWAPNDVTSIDESQFFNYTTWLKSIKFLTNASHWRVTSLYPSIYRTSSEKFNLCKIFCKNVLLSPISVGTIWLKYETSNRFYYLNIRTNEAWKCSSSNIVRQTKRVAFINMYMVFGHVYIPFNLYSSLDVFPLLFVLFANHFYSQ